jgi:molybdopterin converting factor small subunit
MRLRVQYTAQLRAVIGLAEEEVELPEGTSLGELVVRLAHELHREAAPHLLTAAGDVQPSLLVAVNQQAVSPREARTRRMAAGDTVTLMPPIGGG